MSLRNKCLRHLRSYSPMVKNCVEKGKDNVNNDNSATTVITRRTIIDIMIILLTLSLTTLTKANKRE